MAWDTFSTVFVACSAAAGAAYVLLLMRADRRREASAAALASRLTCARCGTRALRCAGWWAETDTGRSGANYRCAACGKEFLFTAQGERTYEREL